MVCPLGKWMHLYGGRRTAGVVGMRQLLLLNTNHKGIFHQKKV
jgi:hypothetical protein